MVSTRCVENFYKVPQLRDGSVGKVLDEEPWGSNLKPYHPRLKSWVPLSASGIPTLVQWGPGLGRDFLRTAGSLIDSVSKSKIIRRKTSEGDTPSVPIFRGNTYTNLNVPLASKLVLIKQSYSIAWTEPRLLSWDIVSGTVLWSLGPNTCTHPTHSPVQWHLEIEWHPNHLLEIVNIKLYVEGSEKPCSSLIVSGVMVMVLNELRLHSAPQGSHITYRSH